MVAVASAKPPALSTTLEEIGSAEAFQGIKDDFFNFIDSAFRFFSPDKREHLREIFANILASDNNKDAQALSTQIKNIKFDKFRPQVFQLAYQDLGSESTARLLQDFSKEDLSSDSIKSFLENSISQALKNNNFRYLLQIAKTSDFIAEKLTEHKDAIVQAAFNNLNNSSAAELLFSKDLKIELIKAEELSSQLATKLIQTIIKNPNNESTIQAIDFLSNSKFKQAFISEFFKFMEVNIDADESRAAKSLAVNPEFKKAILKLAFTKTNSPETSKSILKILERSLNSEFSQNLFAENDSKTQSMLNQSQEFEQFINRNNILSKHSELPIASHILKLSPLNITKPSETTGDPFSYREQLRTASLNENSNFAAAVIDKVPDLDLFFSPYSNTEGKPKSLYSDFIKPFIQDLQTKPELLDSKLSLAIVDKFTKASTSNSSYPDNIRTVIKHLEDIALENLNTEFAAKIIATIPQSAFFTNSTTLSPLAKRITSEIFKSYNYNYPVIPVMAQKLAFNPDTQSNFLLDSVEGDKLLGKLLKIARHEVSREHDFTLATQLLSTGDDTKLGQDNAYSSNNWLLKNDNWILLSKLAGFALVQPVSETGEEYNDYQITSEKEYIQSFFNKLQVYDKDGARLGNILQLDKVPQSLADLISPSKLRMKLLRQANFSEDFCKGKAGNCVNSLFTQALLENIGSKLIYLAPEGMKKILHLDTLLSIAKENPKGRIGQTLSKLKFSIQTTDINNDYRYRSLSQSALNIVQKAKEIGHSSLAHKLGSWIDGVLHNGFAQDQSLKDKFLHSKLSRDIAMLLNGETDFGNKVSKVFTGHQLLRA